MRRALAAFTLFFALASAALAQDVVRLKSGRFVTGTVTLTESDKEGFKVQRWDNGAMVLVRWAQITDAERLRLLNRAPDTSGPTIEMIDGVQALTQTREVIGVLRSEDANQLLIKSREAKNPIPVPKSALLRPYETRKIKITDAYSSDEIIDQKAAKASDYASLMDVGRQAAGFKLYERAKEFYAKALAADPSKKDEVDPILAQNEILIKEGKASTLLTEVKDAIENTEYAKATELAKKLLADFSDTETAKQNSNLVAQIEKEAKDFEGKKAEILAQKVPEMYKAKRAALFSQYSSSKYKVSEARTLAGKIDEEVQKQIAVMLKSTPEEIKVAWDKRDTTKVRSATYGSGTWIVRGGQDGGLDTDAKSQPPPPKNQNNQNGQGGLGGFGGMTGGGGRNRQQQQQQQQKPVDLGKKLETSAEWWSNASQTDRKNFIESEYANTSSCVKKIDEKTKKCTQCQGEGTLKETRAGTPCDVKCPRCHGAKEDVLINYG